MNKRLLVIGIVLIMVLTLVVPAQVLAKSDDRAASKTPFTVDAILYVTDAGHSIQKGLQEKTTGEIVQGTISVAGSNWSVFQGATIIVNHSSEIVFSPSASNIWSFSGTSTNKVEIITSKGSHLRGIADAILTGTFDSTSGKPLTAIDTSSGAFNVSDNQFVATVDNWDVNMTWNDLAGTLVGPAHFAGSYVNRGQN